MSTPTPDLKKKDAKNVHHHAFFLTLSLSVNVVQRYYDEVLQYIRTMGIYYGIKVESGESGKLHIHAIHIVDWMRNDNPDDPKAKARRCGAEHIEYITRRTPNIKSAIVAYGNKHSFQSLPLTSSQWIEYLNKEGDMEVNNFPADLSLLTQYFSDHKGPKVADPQLLADSKQYEIYAELKGKDFPPTHWKQCIAFYHYCYFVDFSKKSVKDDNTVKRYGIALYRYMTQDIELECDNPSVSQRVAMARKEYDKKQAAHRAWMDEQMAKRRKR